MNIPKRIQRKRTKGWRMPEDAVYVGRPTRWGNPFAVLDGETRAKAVKFFESYAIGYLKGVDDWLEPLRGKDLACWCPLDQPCHADALLELANRDYVEAETAKAQPLALESPQVGTSARQLSTLKTARSAARSASCSTTRKRKARMEPIEFPEQTMVWAKNQPPYLPLPAYVNDRETISCWRLTWRERLTVLLRGRLWLRQMNFGSALQPQAPCIDSPFMPAPETTP